MSLKIKQDHARFRDIVRGRIKNNLKKYVQKGEMVGKKGKEYITIPIPTIDIPRFRFGEKQQGGVGQGNGETGDALSPTEGEGAGQAGTTSSARSSCPCARTAATGPGSRCPSRTRTPSSST
jgi:uncharacterized sporulation protein YeaH/YhbH (DUF444 family)